MNTILQDFNTPFNTVPFDKISNSDFLPALKEAIDLAKDEVKKIKENKDTPDFNNTIVALEYSSIKVELVSNIFFNLHSAESNDELQKLAKEFSPMLTKYSNDILLDNELFLRVKTVFDKKDELNLNSEELMLLNKSYKSFIRSGALLDDSGKDKKRAISKRLSELSLLYSDHVLKDTNDFVLYVEDKKDLEGIPDGVVSAAKALAEKKDNTGKWAFTLQFPSMGPFIQYCKNRNLRKEMVTASGKRGANENENNNKEIVKEIITLRKENAELLGFSTHADYILEERMAQKSDTVMSFLNEIVDSARPQAERDVKDIADLALELDGIKDLRPWDYSFYYELLKQRDLKFSEEELKPYFKFENVVEGMFDVAKKLYGLKFRERKDIPIYHEDVLTYEVQDQNDRLVGVFYVDLFPRDGKRSGAWMTEFKKQYKLNGENFCPHAAIVCNFTRPTEEHPSLLTMGEVTTLFHEFGHALHGLLSDCKFISLSSPDVYWDFVELPSQIMENWCYEKECLSLFAKHHETGELIPDELIEKVKKVQTFQSGRAFLRQLSFALLDMAWHTTNPNEIKDVSEFEDRVMSKTSLLPKIEGTLMSCSFSHIFAGGYSAGYYSYMWAAVLDADAFESFKENGLFDQKTATSFRENILSKGGSVHPMDLYKKFKGREPDPKALLRRAGLI